LFPAGSPIPLTGVLAADPATGGLSSALTFNLLGPPSLVAGDVLLVGPAGGLVGVARFNPAGTGSLGYPASLVYYSLGPEVGSCIADTGLPTAHYALTVSTPVVCPTTLVYHPGAGQPGFIAGFDVTFDLTGCPGDVCVLPGNE
jgi:hypothetical protein